MNTSTASTAADSAKQTFGALLGSLTGLGSTWAVYGLKVGSMALVQSADALGKTAKTLDTLATEIEKKNPAAPKADVVVDADAAHAEPAAPVA